jgi:hypothetical protein
MPVKARTRCPHRSRNAWSSALASGGNAAAADDADPANSVLCWSVQAYRATSVYASATNSRSPEARPAGTAHGQKPKGAPQRVRAKVLQGAGVVLQHADVAAEPLGACPPLVGGWRSPAIGSRNAGADDCRGDGAAVQPATTRANTSATKRLTPPVPPRPSRRTCPGAAAGPAEGARAARNVVSRPSDAPDPC